MEQTKKEKIKVYWQTQRPLCNSNISYPFHVRFYAKEWMHSSVETNSLKEMIDWLQKYVATSWSDIIIEQWNGEKWIELHKVEIGKTNRLQSKGVFVLEDIIDDEPVAIQIEAA